MRNAWLIVSLALLSALTGLGEPPPSLSGTDGPTELCASAMTFNIRYGTANDASNNWQHRRGLCNDVINQHGGDFIGLQEALWFQIDEIRAALPRYAETGVGRNDGRRGGEHSAILYDHRRWTLDQSAHGTFWLSDTPDAVASTNWGNTIPRIVTWARFIECATNRAVWVFNTHLDHQSQPSRERSAALLARRIAERANPDEPVIVMGDFNASEDNPAIRYLKGVAPLEGAMTPVTLVDSFRAVHPKATDVGTYSGFEFGRTDGEKIDYVFVERSAKVLDASIIRTSHDDRYPSDHFPVTATVSWAAKENPH